ncbi:MAG: hypothetical protein R2717_00585 [Schumannella sp.]
MLIEQMVGAALSVADDVTVLENGRVAASGGVESFGRPANRSTRTWEVERVARVLRG